MVVAVSTLHVVPVDLLMGEQRRGPEMGLEMHVPHFALESPDRHHEFLHFPFRCRPGLEQRIQFSFRCNQAAPEFTSPFVHLLDDTRDLFDLGLGEGEFRLQIQYMSWTGI